jgi:hypothetical protein
VVDGAPFVWGGLEKSVVRDSFACAHGQLGADTILGGF